MVATNQSGIARGLFDMTTLNAIHDAMQRAVHQAGGRIDAIFFCPHVHEAHCACRKPQPGMLQQIGGRYGLDAPLSGVPVVCDTLRDLQAAQAAGCEPHLVRTGRAVALSAEQLAQGIDGGAQVHVHQDLSGFVDFLLHREHARLGIVGEDSRPTPLQGR